MKKLRDYILEELATPLNTTGMGNVVVPTDNATGTDLFVQNKQIIRKRKIKKHDSKFK